MSQVCMAITMLAEPSSSYGNTTWKPINAFFFWSKRVSITSRMRREISHDDHAQQSCGSCNQPCEAVSWHCIHCRAKNEGTEIQSLPKGVRYLYVQLLPSMEGHTHTMSASSQSIILSWHRRSALLQISLLYIVMGKCSFLFRWWRSDLIYLMSSTSVRLRGYLHTSLISSRMWFCIELRQHFFKCHWEALKSTSLRFKVDQILFLSSWKLPYFILRQPDLWD